MSLGFTCPKSEGNYGTWYQWSVNKCLDTGVRITLVWVTGDPHPFITFYYGNTGCGVFKGGIQNYKGFWLKNNCSQTKLLNFLSLTFFHNINFLIHFIF